MSEEEHMELWKGTQLVENMLVENMKSQEGKA